MYEKNRRPERVAPAAPVEETEGQLEGRNALQEALKSGRTVDKVFIAAGETDRALQLLAAEAKEAGAVVCRWTAASWMPCPLPGHIRV